MSEQIYLGVDIGAESGRVMAGLWNGQRLRFEEIHRFPNGGITVGETLRWDVPRLWDEVQNGLALAAKRFGDQVVSVGVDTWALDYVLLTKTGEMIEQPYCYRDTRIRGTVEELCRRVPREEVFAQSGLQFMEINTLCQWLAHQRQNPEALAKAETFLMIPDYLNWCLSGSKVVEFTNATTTQFFHPTNMEWSVELLRRLNLPTHLLPQVVMPGTQVGTLRESVAQRAGLPRIPVIAPATHDTGSAVAGVPTANTGRANWAYISSGTWSLVGVETRSPQLSARALALNVTNEGGVDGTWRVLKNVMGLWLVQQCKRVFDARGQNYDYAALVKLAEQAESFRSLIDPDDRRFLSPADMPAAIQEFCRESSQPIPETEGQLVRCCFESLALKYERVLGWLEELTGERIEVVHIVGGGARNALLNQFTANACGRPVLAGPVEATVLGNLLVQMRAGGELKTLAQMRAVAGEVEEINRFEPQEKTAWRDARKRFDQLV